MKPIILMSCLSLFVSLFVSGCSVQNREAQMIDNAVFNNKSSVLLARLPGGETPEYVINEGGSSMNLIQMMAQTITESMYAQERDAVNSVNFGGIYLKNFTEPYANKFNTYKWNIHITTEPLGEGDFKKLLNHDDGTTIPYDFKGARDHYHTDYGMFMVPNMCRVHRLSGIFGSINAQIHMGFYFIDLKKNQVLGYIPCSCVVDLKKENDPDYEQMQEAIEDAVKNCIDVSVDFFFNPNSIHRTKIEKEKKKLQK